jgi:hypothetical protein
MILKIIAFKLWITFLLNLNEGKKKEITYFRNGEISTISHYEGGELVKYIDLFPNRQKFQKIK